jgi:hypothetical protein
MRVATVQQLSQDSVIRAIMGLQDTVRKWLPKRNDKAVISIEYDGETYGDFAKTQIRAAIKARRELMKNYILVYDEKYTCSDLPDSRPIHDLLPSTNSTAAAA